MESTPNKYIIHTKNSTFSREGDINSAIFSSESFVAVQEDVSDFDGPFYCACRSNAEDIARSLAKVFSCLHDVSNLVVSCEVYKSACYLRTPFVAIQKSQRAEILSQLHLRNPNVAIFIPKYLPFPGTPAVHSTTECFQDFFLLDSGKWNSVTLHSFEEKSTWSFFSKNATPLFESKKEEQVKEPKNTMETFAASLKDEIPTLIGMINAEQSKSDDIREIVARCLVNLHNAEEAGDIWVDWLADHGYDDDELSDIWAELADEAVGRGLNISHLLFLASKGDSKAYAKWSKDYIDNLVLYCGESTSGDMTVASILHIILGPTHVSTGSRDAVRWYSFVSHKWKKSETVSKKVFDTLRTTVEPLIRAQKDIVERVVSSSEKPLPADVSKLKKYNILLQMMDKYGCLKTFVAGFRLLTRDDYFPNMLDKNPHLICVKNGVIDLRLDKPVLRQGVPSDMLSVCIDTRYVRSCSTYAQGKKWLDDFLFKFQMDEEVRNYVKTLCGLLVFGRNCEKLFPLFIGEKGHEGKSTFENIISETFGKQVCKTVPIEFFCEKGVSATKPQVYLSEMSKARVVLTHEPDQNIMLNSGTVKMHTGEKDEITYRNLYESSISTFVPQYLIMIFSNKPLIINWGDLAMCERYFMIPCVSRFVKNAPETLEEQMEERVFPRDTDFSSKVEAMRVPFLVMCIDEWFKYKNSGKKLEPPQAVIDTTKKYRKESDVYWLFFKDCLKKVATGESISVDELYIHMQNWWEQKQSRNPNVPTLERFAFSMSAILGEPTNSEWKGYVFSMRVK